MELLEASRSVVVVIDLQGKLVEAVVRPKLVMDATLRLMKMADLFGVPVLLTEQYPKGIGATHPAVQQAYEALTTTKRKMEKTSFGCFGDAKFAQLLTEVRPGIAPAGMQLVIAGIEAHVCVMATVMEGMRLGYGVHVCWECVSGRGAEYRQHALARMAAAGAEVTNHESVAFEWARDKDHPQFKSMSQLLKQGQYTE